MKFTAEHYKNLLDCIESTGIDLNESRKQYISKSIGNNPELRFIWDVFWASKYSKIHVDESRLYLDKHIETATKKAINELIKLELKHLKQTL